MDDAMQGTLRDRVEGLERENRRLKLAGALGLALLAALALMGQARARTVEAHRVVVRDAGGQLRAELTAAGLSIYDGKEKIRAALGVGGDARSGLSLYDPGERTRMTLYVASDGGAAIQLADERGSVVWKAP
jgi:hypothetical protein